MRATRVAALVLVLGLAPVVRADDDLKRRAVAAYNEQDWEIARHLLRAARKALPKDRELPLMERTAIQNIAGARFNKQDYAGALSVLDEAERIDVGTVPAHVAAHAENLRAQASSALGSAGPSADAQGQSQDASAGGQAVATQSGTADAQAARDLWTLEQEVNALVTSGNTEAAVKRAREGLAQFPTSSVLNRIVGLYDPAAKGDRSKRKRVEAGNFVVRFRGIEPDAEIEARVVDALHSAEATLSREFGFTLDKVANVVIYASGQDFVAGGASGWSEANYNGSVQVPVEVARMGLEHLTETVTHELGHHMVALMTHGRVPAWFNEGVAEVAAGNRRFAAVMRAVLSDPAQRAQLYKLSDLRTQMDPGGDAGRVAMAYGMSSSVLKRVVDQLGVAGVAGILADCKGGMGFEAAFSGRTGKSVTEFEREWLAALLGEYGL